MKVLGIFWFALLYLLTPSITAPTATTTKSPLVKTPERLEDIFKARCIEYTTVVEPKKFEKNPKNCNELWGLFRKAFADKPECSIQPEDYTAFVEAADHYTNLTDRLLLWNGRVYPFVRDFARQSNKYITIRDQLAVYILKNIDNWCGQSEKPGINYNRCPNWGSCEHHAVSAFWKRMSKHFVKKARGTIFVMFNATEKVVFNQNSIFAKSELVNLNKEDIQVLHAILVTNLKGVPTENCKQGSMRVLRKIVEKKGMRFRCWDHNKKVRHLQCLQSPDGCSPGMPTLSSLPLITSLAIATIVSLLQ